MTDNAVERVAIALYVADGFKLLGIAGVQEAWEADREGVRARYRSLAEAAVATMTDIDWRKLFILYGVHVSECEGYDFLGRIGEPLDLADGLSEDERAALLKAREEIRETWAKG